MRYVLLEAYEIRVKHSVKLIEPRYIELSPGRSEQRIVATIGRAASHVAAQPRDTTEARLNGRTCTMLTIQTHPGHGLKLPGVYSSQMVISSIY